MAVVKIRKVKATLAKSIAYVTDPAKTDGQRLASTTTGHDIADCDAIAAAFLNNLESTKGGSARKGAVLALHVIQSFDPDDPITPEPGAALAAPFEKGAASNGRLDFQTVPWDGEGQIIAMNLERLGIPHASQRVGGGVVRFEYRREDAPRVADMIERLSVRTHGLDWASLRRAGTAGAQWARQDQTADAQRHPCAR